jgi:capsular exopolysaccharide synthesis family protein
MRLDAPQKALEAYQARLVQLSTQVGSEQPDARIISLAPLPIAPSSPNWVLNMALSLVLGAILGLIAVVARMLFSVGVASAEEVEHDFGLNFLAALPSIKHSDEMALVDKVVDEPGSAFAEALRGLATSVLFTGSAPPRVLALSSAFAEEGKSTTSIALGRVIALRGRRVLVIDCDVQRPSFYRRFGLGGERGLVDVVQDQLPIEQAIVPDGRSPAHFLSLGRDLDPSQSLNETAMQDLLGMLSNEYDVVLLDLPPVLQVAETRVFAGLADTTVLLVRWKRTSRAAIDQALSILFRANAAVSGVALTQVPASSTRALYGYARPTHRLEAPAA